MGYLYIRTRHCWSDQKDRIRLVGLGDFQYKNENTVIKRVWEERPFGEDRQVGRECTETTK